MCNLKAEPSGFGACGKRRNEVSIITLRFIEKATR
jgi:hypothetical protein